MPRLKIFMAHPGTLIRSMRELTVRERQHLTAEILHARGLMPLLMKSRNGQRWTPEEKQQIAGYLRRLSSLSPYLVVLAMPGGMLMLPALAWWLDRRRNERRSDPVIPA